MTKETDCPITPLCNRVVIKRDESEGTSKGGIVLPDTAKEKPKRGTIVAAGPGLLSEDLERIPMDLRPGDIVYFNAYSGSAIEIDRQEYLIMKEEEVLCKVNR